jgi:HlyD family secretion protein
MKKFIIILLLVCAVAAGWYYGINNKVEVGQQDKPDWKTIPVERGFIRMVVESTGRVVPELEVEIKCKASGEVINLPVDVSDRVKKGDLLVQLDPDDEKRSVERAEVALTVSQARLSQAKLKLEATERDLSTERMRTGADLGSAEAKKLETKAKLDRVEQLIKKEIASPQELEVAQAEHAKATADLESARARAEDIKTWDVQIASLRQEIKIAEAQVVSDKLSLSDARQRLEDTTVFAPIDGVVAERNVQVGQIIASGINNVGGGTAVMKLADLSRIYVLVSVDESDIGSIEVGQQSQITVDSHPDVVFPGQVVRVATKGTIDSNVVTFEVKVEIAGSDQHLLKPEMTANVEIVVAQKESVLLVPVAAMERGKREHFVTVKKNGISDKRTVETGISDGEFMEVISGLSEGEQILIPENISQGRWGKADKKDNKNGGKGGNVRRDVIRMRMMGGRRRR